MRQNVSGLRTTLANTQSAINNVAPSVATRSQGSLVTGGQQSALGNLERQPLDKAYGEENTSLGNANSDLTNLLGQAGTQADLGYKSSQDKIANLKDLYTAAAQREQAQRDEAFRQQQLADQRTATAKASSGSASSGSVGTSSKATPSYGYTTDSSGGFQFSGPGNKPVTAAQYVSSQGGSFQDLVSLLSKSKNPGDAQIINDMKSGLSQQALTTKYPWVFGGV